MTAEELVNRYGEKLIGRKVKTIRVGGWPGGIATVSKINPDPEAPEIAFDVSADFWPHGDMGVFANEPVILKRKMKSL